MHPVDPGEHWLEAGITGLARQREWDAVVTVAAPGTRGDEAELVVLAGGRMLLEVAPDGFDATPIAAALEGAIEPPYRALARRRDDLWAVGAAAIDVQRLDPDPGGTDLELTFDGTTLALTADGRPVDASAADALRSLAESRVRGAFAAHAHRLAEDLWEVQILPL